MTVTEIRSLLEAPYNQADWKVFLQTHFINVKLYGTVQSVELSDKSLIEHCFALGNYEVDEYTKIGIFEIKLKDNVKLTRNRVGLRNTIKSISNQVAGAMVVFTQGSKWRFSYISKRKVKNKHTNQLEDKETAPKRYTYLFGSGEKAKTAADRFSSLIDQQKTNLFQSLTTEDFEYAFSVERLSKEFFEQYKNTYEDFVEYLTGKRYKKSGNRYIEQVVKEPNYQLRNLFGNNEKEARDFCKRMMGRIVFLYFIQKKGWLAVEQGKKWGEGKPNYLYELFDKCKNKENFYNTELVNLFFRTLNNEDSESDKNKLRFPYLNGGLFDDLHDKKYNKLILPAHIFSTLFETFNNFNFTVYEDAPDEQTVAVDPEMLGHIFENLLEDNKDKGAFYTPKEIVHFMCQQSIEAYLLAKEDLHLNDDVIAKPALHKIIHQKELSDTEKKFAEKNAYKIIDALENVKICDPAIGSGAFPMGILQEIFNAQIYLQELKGFKKDITDADIKKHIIQECIYGVDIEPGAVDIARLRFWLSLVVDEELPQPLPNLDFKIVCANSVVELGNITYNDVSGNYKIVEEMAQVRHKYFSASKQLKDDLEKEFNTLQHSLFKNAKDWVTKADAEIYHKLLDFTPFQNKSCSWFDEKWMLGIKDGFDIVIGNPPYIKEYTNKSAFDGFRKSKYYQGKMDLWYAFACMMIDKLKPNGVQCYIAQNNWITSAGASKLRDKILSDTKILSFIDFGNYKVFASAGIQTMIYLIQKVKVKQGDSYDVQYSLLINEDLAQENLIEFLDFEIQTPTAQKYLYSIKSTSTNALAFTFNTTDDEVLLNEIASKANYKFGDKEIAQGIVPNPDVVNNRNIEKFSEAKLKQFNIKAGDGVFVVKKGTFDNLNDNEKKYIKPVFEPKEVSRYFFKNDYEYEILYITKSNYKNDAPNLLSHLKKYEEIMNDRRENQNGRLEYFHLHWPRDEHYFEKGEKILSVRKCDKPTFIYTENPAYVMMSFNIIKSYAKSHKFLTALLNSRLIEYWLKNKGKMQGNNFQIDKEPLLNIPMVIPEDVSQFETLVDYLLFLNDDTNEQILNHTHNSRIAVYVEEVINMLVYELYFLNHMKEVGIDVSPYIKPIAFTANTTQKQKAEIIKEFYEWYQTPENPVRQSVLLIETRSNDKIAIINKSTL